MNTARTALYTGLCYSLPLLVWTLPQLQGLTDSNAARVILVDTASLTFLLQALLAALFVPRFLSHCHWPNALAAVLLLLSIPWPLLALAWLADATDTDSLILSQSVVITLALVLLVLAKRLGQVARRNNLGNWTLPALQLAAFGLVVGLRTWFEGILA